MKLIIILVITGITIAASDLPEDAEVTTKDNEHGTYGTGRTLANSSEEEQMRSTPISIEQSTPQINVTTPVKSHKKPVFKIVQKAVKMKHGNYWKTATRRPPIMKNMKFIIDKDKESHRKHDIEQFRTTMSSKNDDSSEEDSETSTVKEKRQDGKKHVKTLIRRFHKLGSKISREKDVESMKKFKERVKTPTARAIKSNKVDFDKSSGENEDKEEFIFVTPKNIQERIGNVGEESDESGETTTMVIEKELKVRHKRSINVIEEENLGTTVSGFKFTGKFGSLNSNFAFRNINT